MRKKTVNVGISEERHAALSAFCDRRKMILRDVVDGLAAWFLAQRSGVQTAVLGVVDEDMREAYASAMERLAAELRGMPSTHQGEAVAPHISIGADGARPLRAGSEAGKLPQAS